MNSREIEKRVEELHQSIEELHEELKNENKTAWLTLPAVAADVLPHENGLGVSVKLGKEN